MAATKAQAERRHRLADRAAIPWVSRAILESVREIGGEIVQRPAIPGRDEFGTIPVANPADGLVAAQAIEQHATATLRRYMRDAREAGMGWRKIGELLELDRAARHEDTTVAEAACGADVEDEGPQTWPTDFRHGHVKGCQRLAAEVRELNRAWREAGE
jgi:hypothetical protein